MSERTLRIYANIEGAGYEIKFDDSAQSENWRQGVEGITWDSVELVNLDGVEFVNEQRYEQLAQVAKNMLLCMKQSANILSLPKYDDVWSFEIQLEELGVDLDG